MTIEFSFKYYIENYQNMEIYNFNEYFNERVDILPDKLMSSKRLMTLLNIENELERKLFKDVFLKYFKEKMLYIE